jgi:hypothetical protein
MAEYLAARRVGHIRPRAKTWSEFSANLPQLNATNLPPHKNRGMVTNCGIAKSDEDFDK